MAIKGNYANTVIRSNSLSLLQVLKDETSNQIINQIQHSIRDADKIKKVVALNYLPPKDKTGRRKSKPN